MNLVLKIGFIAVLIFSFVFASWYALHNDINFTSDIGRDFFILEEISQKHLILIGPKTSSGLFHGPLWPYVNYPFYLIGNGDPVVVGWGWVLFVAFFSASSFYVAKNLFDKSTAYAYSALVTLYAAFHARGMINPHGAMLLIPLFFLFYIKYLQTLKPIFLIANMVTLGLIIQFQMAIGIPLLLLSSIVIIYKQIKTKNYLHVLCFGILAFFIANFALFDLRHDFLYTNRIFNYLKPAASEQTYSLLADFQNRVKLAFTGPEILRQDPGYLNFILVLVSSVLIYFQIKDKKYKLIYYSFIYFYLGFFVLSFINKGQILYFHLFPIFPLVILIFSSFVTSRYKKAFFILFLIVLFANIRTAIIDMANSKQLIGKNEYSWLFLKNAAEKMFEGKENEFGYFVYSPDVVAYEAKYAAKYLVRSKNKQSYYFTKKPITYLLIAPPPPDNPLMKDSWWKENQLKINASASAITNFDNGYKIERYELTDEDINVEFDRSIDPGLHFR